MGASGHVSYRLAATEAVWASITQALALDVESAGVLTARIGTGPDGTTFLARQVFWVPDHAYRIREGRRLSISSQGYVPALGRAADDGAVAVFFHTHPRAAADHSSLDDEVDRQVRQVFLQRSRQRLFISLVVGGTSDNPSFNGRVYGTDPEPATLEGIRVVGDRLRVFQHRNGVYVPPQQFDRQVRAFGREGQAIISGLNIGVVGAGGTGSAVCEQLLRLGIGHITVLDDDDVEDTNLSRIHEADRGSLGRKKVEVMVDRGGRIALGSSIRGIPNRLRTESAARQLTGCDAIFGCTDDIFGRAILSRLAYWYLVPVFDMGFLIHSQAGQISGLYGRVSSIMPGTSCLICRGRISAQDIYYESLSSEERLERIREGYAPELAEPDPSVVTYTTLVASFAVSELLERLFGFGSGPRSSELILRFGDRTISRTSIEGRVGHYCTDQTLWATGDEDPMLGQLWPAS